MPATKQAAQPATTNNADWNARPQLQFDAALLEQAGAIGHLFRLAPLPSIDHVVDDAQQRDRLVVVVVADADLCQPTIDQAMCDIDQGHVFRRGHLPIGVRRVAVGPLDPLRGIRVGVVVERRARRDSLDPLAAQTDAAMCCWIECDGTLAAEPDVMLRPIVRAFVEANEPVMRNGRYTISAASDAGAAWRPGAIAITRR